ncbi:MAG: TIGR03086 family metal-binding protein [Actinomycetota bacterium]
MTQSTTAQPTPTDPAGPDTAGPDPAGPDTASPDTGDSPGAMGDMPDPRPVFLAALAQAAPVIAAVEKGDLRRPTPCTEFDVEDLARHLVAVGRRAIAMAEGQPAESVGLDAADVATDGLAAEWDRATTALAEHLERDEILGQPMVLPWDTLPGTVMLSIYSAEVQIHSWDLAVSLGLTPAWNHDLAAFGLGMVKVGIPAEGRNSDEMPFDPVVPTAADAPALDQLVAWVGRDPAWSAPAG